MNFNGEGPVTELVMLPFIFALLIWLITVAGEKQ
jgi:hypothetical protein